jgi:hypothetical protein
MVHLSEHVKDPFSAELEKTDFEIRVAIQHAVPNQSDKG